MPTYFSDRRPNERVFLLAGIDLIAEVGIDRISVSKIVDSTRLTRPTFYSFFEGIPGFLSVLWTELGPAWLEKLVQPEYEIAKSNSAQAKYDRVTLEILSAAHRLPEVLEVVEPIAEKWWSNIQATGVFNATKTSWLVAERIGVELTLPIDKFVVQARFMEQLLPLMPELDKQKNYTPTKSDMSELGAVEIPDKDGKETLIAAAIAVISKTGVLAASMSRIARRAQVTTGSLYPKFSSVDEIIEASFEAAIKSVVDQNFAALAKTSFAPEDFGKFVIAGMGKARENWRNYRLEIHLEARHRKSLRSRMAKDLLQNNAQLSAKLANYPHKELVQGPVPYLMQAVGMGFSALQNAGIPVTQLDHPRFTRELVEALDRLATSKTTKNGFPQASRNY